MQWMCNFDSINVISWPQLIWTASDPKTGVNLRTHCGSSSLTAPAYVFSLIKVAFMSTGYVHISTLLFRSSFLFSVHILGHSWWMLSWRPKINSVAAYCHNMFCAGKSAVVGLLPWWNTVYTLLNTKSICLGGMMCMCCKHSDSAEIMISIGD